MRIVVATDTHLNFCEDKIPAFCATIMAQKPDAVIITGDISEAPSLTKHLALMDDRILCPMFWVNGNHDYYRGSIAEVRAQMNHLYGPDNSLTHHWLPLLGSVSLTNDTALVGHDGWYDGGYGNWFDRHTVRMADYDLIEELRQAAWYPEALYDKIRGLAKEGMIHMETWVPEAAKAHKNVIIATHVPPFMENAVYDPHGPGTGQPSNAQWMPNFSSAIMGMKLMDLAERYPDNTFTVLCGHSHGRAIHKPTDNMTCITGYSRYHFPETSIQVLEVP